MSIVPKSRNPRRYIFCTFADANVLTTETDLPSAWMTESANMKEARVWMDDGCIIDRLEVRSDDDPLPSSYEIKIYTGNYASRTLQRTVTVAMTSRYATLADFNGLQLNYNDIISVTGRDLDATTTNEELAVVLYYRDR